jgi:hypothetical protein
MAGDNVQQYFIYKSRSNPIDRSPAQMKHKNDNDKHRVTSTLLKRYTATNENLYGGRTEKCAHIDVIHPYDDW